VLESWGLRRSCGYAARPTLERHPANAEWVSVNIAVISDLHLGSEDKVDSFGHVDAEFLRFLEFLESNFERIVLLGDIWETLTSRCPFNARRGLAEARRRHPDIARRLTRPSYKYIHGNHDLIAGAVDRAPEQWALDVDGKRLLFMHGHPYDRLLRMARHIAELGVWLGGWIRRAGWHGLYQHLDRLDQKRAAVSLDAERCTFQAWAVDVASRERADIVVTGHTHVAVATEHGSRLYMNSGSCSRGRYTYLALDTRRDVYGVHHAW
jgi:predicted phosphodiesterase